MHIIPIHTSCCDDRGLSTQQVVLWVGFLGQSGSDMDTPLIEKVKTQGNK